MTAETTPAVERLAKMTNSTVEAVLAYEQRANEDYPSDDTAAVRRGALALRTATGVTYPWALGATPKVLAHALDVEEMARAIALTRHGLHHRDEPDYTEPTNWDRRIASDLRAALLGGAS